MPALIGGGTDCLLGMIKTLSFDVRTESSIGVVIHSIISRSSERFASGGVATSSTLQIHILRCWSVMSYNWSMERNYTVIYEQNGALKYDALRLRLEELVMACF